MWTEVIGKCIHLGAAGQESWRQPDRISFYIPVIIQKASSSFIPQDSWLPSGSVPRGQVPVRKCLSCLCCQYQIDWRKSFGSVQSLHGRLPLTQITKTCALLEATGLVVCYTCCLVFKLCHLLPSSSFTFSFLIGSFLFLCLCSHFNQNLQSFFRPLESLLCLSLLKYFLFIYIILRLFSMPLWNVIYQKHPLMFIVI